MDRIGIVFVICTFIIISIFYIKIFSKRHLGKIVVQMGKCKSNSLNCRDLGTRTITSTCVSDNQNDTCGNGMFVSDTITTSETCEPTCRKSFWLDHEVGKCTVKDNLTGCVDLGSVGNRTRNVECVRGDDFGINTCTSLELLEHTGPLGLGKIHKIKLYNIGDVVSMEEECTNYTNKICGKWKTNKNNIISPCNLGKQLSVHKNCITGVSKPFDSLVEGYVEEDMLCTKTIGNVEVIRGNDVCHLVKELISCSSGTTDPVDIRNGTLPLDFTPTICRPTDDIPKCVRVCRMYPNKINVGIFSDITGAMFTLRIKNQGYFTAENLPIDVDGKLEDTKIVLIDDGTGISSLCNSKSLKYNTEYNTSIMFCLGVRRYDGNTIKAQISCIIGGSYVGWLSVNKSNEIIWEQAYNIYGAPGSTTTDAYMFTIKNYVKENDLGSNHMGFGNNSTYKGMCGIDLKSNTGGNLYIKDVRGKAHELNHIVALIINIESVLNRSDIFTECNLLYKNNN
ncbi:MAG: hypothetical protein COA94_08705 [Rickettsiales bacterium]|nr:MAG: hypothetical protein COA94_08705 [Rickettsiales bacterium]